MKPFLWRKGYISSFCKESRALLNTELMKVTPEVRLFNAFELEIIIIFYHGGVGSIKF